MNSQFKNSNLGFYLYAVIIVMIAVASIFVFWYMVKGYKLGTYDENTILGSVYLGGIKEDEVEAKLRRRVELWLKDDTIIFETTYQGYSYEFDRELFYFDYDLSIYNLVQGEANDLVVSFQGTDRVDIFNELQNLEFVEASGVYFDFERLINDVRLDAGFMKSYSSKKLEDYLIDESVAISEISSVELNIPEGMFVDDVISGVNNTYQDSKIMLNSKELFDVVAALGGELSDSEMSVLATGMLDLVQETNFPINEIHYVPTIDYITYTINSYPYFGHNVNVNQTIDSSFSFYNPNDSDYYFMLEKTGETTAILSLYGLPFVNEIIVNILEDKIDYITQETDNDQILQIGYDGMIINVQRTITDIYDNILYDKIILFEFYPPIKEIILEPN